MEILKIKQMLEGEEMEGENGVSIPNRKQTVRRPRQCTKSHPRTSKEFTIAEHRIQVKGTEYLEMSLRDTNKTM